MHQERVVSGLSVGFQVEAGAEGVSYPRSPVCRAHSPWATVDTSKAPEHWDPRAGVCVSKEGSFCVHL